MASFVADYKEVGVANVRVEFKKIPGKDDFYCMRAMIKEFRKQVGLAGVSTESKRHQYFESKASVERRKLRERRIKRQQEDIARRLLSGEKIRCSSKMVKKVRDRQAKEARTRKMRQNNEF